MTRFVRVTMRGEFNSIPLPRNCILEVTQPPEALETSDEGIAEVVKTTRFVGVTMRCEVNSIPLDRKSVV